MTKAELRRKKQEEAKKKMEEDYNKNRDPIKEFF